MTRSMRPENVITNMNLILASMLAAFSTGGLVQLLVWLLIAAIVIYVIFLVLGMLPLPPQVKTIATLIIAVVVLLIILNKLGILATIGFVAAIPLLN